MLVCTHHKCLPLAPSSVEIEKQALYIQQCRRRKTRYSLDALSYWYWCGSGRRNLKCHNLRKEKRNCTEFSKTLLFGPSSWIILKFGFGLMIALFRYHFGFRFKKQKKNKYYLLSSSTVIKLTLTQCHTSHTATLQSNAKCVVF